MKKTISIIASGLVALIFSISSNAQGNMFQPGLTTSKNPLLSLIPGDAGRDESINAKAVKDFNKRFKGVENVKWSNTELGGYVGWFNANDVVVRSYYNKQGNWQYTVSGYGENKLISSVRNLVKFTYYDFNITYVQEIDRLGEPGKIYLIQIQDKNSLKVLRVVQDELEVIDELQKS